MIQGGIHMNSKKLWYTKAASEWTQALPLGNGHMGAMCYGDVLVGKGGNRSATGKCRSQHESGAAGAP